jgi:hypothetical protein
MENFIDAQTGKKKVDGLPWYRHRCVSGDDGNSKTNVLA